MFITVVCDIFLISYFCFQIKPILYHLGLNFPLFLAVVKAYKKIQAPRCYRYPPGDGQNTDRDKLKG